MQIALPLPFTRRALGWQTAVAIVPLTCEISSKPRLLVKITWPFLIVNGVQTKNQSLIDFVNLRG